MYEKIYKKFRKVIEKYDLGGEGIRCEVLNREKSGKGSELNKDGYFSGQYLDLPSEEYALMRGEEVIVRSSFKGSYGDAFTDKPRNYCGKVKEIPNLLSRDEDFKSIFFSSLNAVLSYVGLTDKTVHCRGDDPEKCGESLKNYILEEFGGSSIAHIGYQPGHVKSCSKVFDSCVTDLNPENIGSKKFGRRILDGERNEEIIKKVDIACITGSTIVNGSLPEILSFCKTYDTDPIVYGVSAKGSLELIGMDCFCPFGRDMP